MNVLNTAVVATLLGVAFIASSLPGETAISNDTPKIQTVSANSSKVEFNVSGEASRKSVCVFVNNECKKTIKTNRAEYSYQSDFPIRVLEVKAKNQTGTSISKFNIR